ncbi:MAG: peptidylprolyl isomerase [Candidatus Aminicenantes bacterium]|nr:peptidylprolyl isomerase [Candidatus Aminicenantes bacterium]
MAQKVKKGDKVKLHYTGRLKDGKVFDSSEDQDPLQFEAGTGQVIKGVDEAVIGMEPGAKKKITIDPEKAYGDYDKKLLIDVPKDKVPEDMKPKKGSMLRLMDKQGRAVPVTVTEVKDDAIQVDANHPLAGKKLDFEIEIVEIV